MSWSTDISEFESLLPNPSPWIDKSMQLYEKILSEKKGKMIFIAGEMRYGKTSLMYSLAESFKKRKPKIKIVDASYFNGKFHPLVPEKAIDKNQGIDASGNIASFAEKALPVISPRLDAAASFFGFMGQSMQTFASNQKFVTDFWAANLNEFQIPQWLSKKIRKLVADEPLVCIIDDYPEDILGTFLYTLAKEMAVDLPILFFVSIRGGKKLPEKEVIESELKTIARELVTSGYAEWWDIKPLTYREISDWIKLPVRSDIVTALYKETEGIPRQVQSFWREWRAEEIVYFNEEKYSWEWSAQAKVKNNYQKLLDLLKKLLKTNDFARIKEVEKILAMAALEGKTFTSEAVALAFIDIDSNIDNEMIGNLFDDYLVRSDDNPQGLLRAESFLKLGTEKDSPSVFRYSFIEEFDKELINRYALTSKEKLKFADSLLTALIAVYEPHEKLIAAKLSRLYQFLGITSEAEHFQMLSQYQDLRLSALSLANTDTSEWDKFLCKDSVNFLYEAGLKIQFANPNEDYKIFKKVEELAEKTGNRYIKAESLLKLARARSDVLLLDEALGLLKRSELLFIELNSLQRLNSVFLEFGITHHRNGNYKDSEADLLKALKGFENAPVISQQNLATTYSELGKLYSLERKDKKSESFLRQAIKIFEKLYPETHPFNAICYLSLGRLYELQNKLEKAEVFQLKAKEIFENVYPAEHQYTAINYSCLGVLYIKKQEFEKAHNYIQKAIIIYEKTVSPEQPGTGIYYRDLAEYYYHINENEKAESYLLKAKSIFEKTLYSEHPYRAQCCFRLGKLYNSQKKFAEAKEYLEKALAIQRKKLRKNHPETIATKALLEEVEKNCH